MFRKLTVFFLLAALILSLGLSASAETYDVSYAVVFAQDGCRDMLQMINDFRTGSDAWYWAEDDETKVWPENLQALVYDYDLERIAMQRAAECVLHYDHTRPDGTRCFTAFTENDIISRGENIAVGYNSMSTPAEAFNAWREQNEPYAGQGHRRNMLNARFNCIGVGHVQYGECDFWAQALGYRETPNTAATSSNNQTTVVYVTVNSDLFTESTAGSLAVSSVTLEYGVPADLPVITAQIRMEEQWPAAYRDPDEVTLYPAWTSADPACVEINGTQALGKAVGQTSLSASVFGQSLSLSAAVACSTLLTPDFILPRDLTRIEDDSFYETGAVAVEIPESVTVIGQRAFYACQSLRQITIPSSVTQIADDAFDECSSDLVVCCQAGSRAETVALQYGFTIVYLQ
ncbi:MAG: leucine-rich repeat protein [Clostridia bacterium]|nr:leucine-rich repeat protein [Clostridia bacterium]